MRLPAVPFFPPNVPTYPCGNSRARKTISVGAVPTTDVSPPDTGAAQVVGVTATRVPRHRWAAWLAELLGTALMLFGGFSMTALVGAPSSPLFVRAMTQRVFVIGLSYGVMVALVAVSPIGRSSGAHLNPAVTVAFWCRRAVSTSDAVAYVVAQCVGALAAAIAFSAIWRSWATAVHGARTIPRPGLGAAATAMIEAGMTFVLVAAIFVVSTSPRWRRWTPVAVLVLLTVMIVVAGPVTGGSFNPARSLGPALVTHQWQAFLAYVVGPLAGALVAVLATHRRSPRT